MDRPREADGGIADWLFNAGAFVAAAVTMIWDRVTDDGLLAAAARQGADELGQALKAFPDSIQVQETGTLWNPTQAEVTNSRLHGYDDPSQDRNNGLYSAQRESYRSPSDLAAAMENRAVQDAAPEYEHDHDHGHEM